MWNQGSVFQLLIVQSGQKNTGLFVYDGVPAAGNPPVFSVVAPGITTDPFGNGVQAILVAGNQLNPRLLVDAGGNASVIATDGSALTLSPQVNLGIALTSALIGTILGQLSLTSSDVNETVSGAVADVVLGSGTGAKMATLVMSPYGTQGMGMLLQAQNDGGTDTPLCTFGTVTTQGFELTFQPVLAISPFALLLYGSGGTITVVTKTSGSGTIPIPVGVSTAKAECWGGGGGGGGAPTGGPGAGGGGGGEYAAEPALAVTGGGTVAYAVGAAGTGGASPGGSGTGGGNSTLTGSAVTVTGHGGGAGTATVQGTGGTGYAGTTSHAGGRGGFASGLGGGGGGSSGGTSAAGNNGHAGSASSGGAGGTAPAGGGAGGNGGAPVASPGDNGLPGHAPGGAGGAGGASFLGLGTGAGGAAGQVRLTYSTGAPAILMAVAQASGTDQFGTGFQPGLFLAETATPATPTLGMSLYVDNTGHLHALGLSGTNTTLANP